MPKKAQVVVTPEQYRALQAPVTVPMPQDLLDFQVETLVTKKLMAYSDADPFSQDLPQGLFLLIPPRPKELNLDRLMPLIVVDGASGVNYLEPQRLKDEVNTPSGAYLMEGVDDGDARRNIKPSVNRHNILAEDRFPFTTFEGIILATLFPEVLKHHFLDLIGSRYGSKNCPMLYLFSAKPALGQNWKIYAYPEWGAPSCVSRRGA